jgi:outer membrane lipoprotein carrier protein
VEQIETAYQKIGTFQASFRQESYLLGLDSRDYSSGTVVFEKPGKMKWIYQQPEHQQFVADGKMAWFYQPQLQQVTLTDYSDAFSSDLPVTFLLGLGSLNDTFKTAAVCTTTFGIKLELEPKAQDGSLELLHLLVDHKSYEPLGARIDNVGGNETTIVFSDPILNKALDKELFSFSIPRGMDIIDNRKGPH